MCRRNMWVALIAAAVVAVVVSPGAGVIGSFLVLAACPLMMLVLGGGMARMGRGDRVVASRDRDDDIYALRAEVAELHDRVQP